MTLLQITDESGGIFGNQSAFVKVTRKKIMTTFSLTTTPHCHHHHHKSFTCITNKSDTRTFVLLTVNIEVLAAADKPA